MGKTTKRILALMASGMMLTAALSGCGSTDSKATPAASSTAAPAGSGLDTSKRVSLQFWMLGDAPKDLPDVEAKVNEMAAKDINATVKFNYTTWTDWDQKYKLMLTSGQEIDLLFTAEWTDYQRYARSGAFLALDEIVPKAAPELNKFIPKQYWDAVRVGGKIYTMPDTYKEYVQDGFEYREDLRKKYNLPEIKDLSSIEAYLDAIVKNEKTMVPLADGVAGDDFTALSSIVSELIHPWTDRAMPKYGLAATNDKPAALTAYWGSEDHKKDLELAKRWADKGYWSRSILSSKDDASALFNNGKVSAKSSGINPTKYANDVSSIKTTHPDWEIGFFPYCDVTRVAHPVHPTHNGYAVPKTSKNPERAVAFFEKLILDKRYNLLTNYGIEGKNYTVDNGYYKMTGDQNSNGFPREAMNSWAWRNPSFMLFTPDYDPVKKIFAKMDTYATPDVFNGFAENYTPYQTERAALQQVQAKYLQMLQAGFVKDVDAGLKEFMEKAKAAGLEKIQAEYTKQYKAYTDEMGIK